MQKRDGWRNPKHSREWLSSLSRFAFPRIGKVPVSEVTRADVLEILSPIWHVKPDMAGKLRQHMRAVLEWAVAMELRLDNPCDRSSFRDWAAEETDHPREVIEAALAHVVRNRVEAAYARSDLFERRRRLMDDWAGYLAGPSRGPQA